MKFAIVSIALAHVQLSAREGAAGVQAITSACPRSDVDAAGSGIDMARVVSLAGDGLVPAEVTNSPEGYVTGFAGPVSHGYCSHLGGEPVEQRAALAHVAQLSQDFCGTAVTCTLEGHSDLPIGRRIDESLDAPREPVDLIDQGLEYSHQDSLPNRRLVRVNSTTSVSSIAALNGPAVINRWAVL